MAVTPNSIVTPQAIKSASVVATAAKTTYADATNAVALMIAGANGSRLTKLVAIPRGTVTATQLQLLHTPSGGAITFLDSAVMQAYTMAQTTQASKTDFGYSDANPLILGAGDTLSVGIGVALAAGVTFHAEWQDY